MSNNVIFLLGRAEGGIKMSAGTKVTVSVRNNDVEFALRKFKNQVARNGNLSKARERAEGYKKPGVRLKEEIKKNTINSRKNKKNTINARKNNKNY